MKKILLILFTFTLLSPCYSQSWLWARQGTNYTTLNDGAAIAIDKQHNAYFTGSYSNDTLIFGTDTLSTVKGTARQTFLLKYDENGNLLWARSSQCQDYSNPQFGAYSTAVTTDIHNNVYITGNYSDSLYFPPYAVLYYNPYNPLVFVTKYDESGNVKWAKQCTRAGGRGNVNCGEGVVTDKSGNVYVTGYFGDTISFDIQTLKTTTVSAFLVKYDSSGNLLWAKQAVNGKGNNNINGGNNIAIDILGYIYISGYFADTAYFDNHLLTSTFADAFLAKYDSNGNVIWAMQSHNASSKSNAAGYGICTDKNNNIYVTGQINDTVNFGVTALISPYEEPSIYWTKYDSSGNVLWAKQMHDLNSLQWDPFDIDVDNSKNLYLTGMRNVVYNSNVNVVFDSDTLRMNKTGNAFTFIKMDSAGKVLNGYLFPQTPADGGAEPLAVDTSGCYVYFGGTVDTTVTFGPDVLGTSVNPNAINYPFIARWSDGKCKENTGINSIENSNIVVTLYPNPTSQILNLIFNRQISRPVTLQIMDITGRTVANSQLTIHNSQLKIDVALLTPGMYFINLKNKNLYVTQKFIKL